MRKERTTYSQEFKIKAVELSNERGSVNKAADELNVSRETLRHWKREHKAGKYTGENKVLKTKSAEQEELIRLKKELSEVKLERDILKKAVGIFSKSDR